MYTVSPTCGHEALTYKTLKLAKAHAQAHADRSGCALHITGGTRTIIITPSIYGVWLPCEVA